jgi:hypothetical protein
MLDPDRLIPIYEAACLINSDAALVYEWVTTGRVPFETREGTYEPGGDLPFYALVVPRQQFLHSLYYRNGRLEPLTPPPNGRPLPAPPRSHQPIRWLPEPQTRPWTGKPTHLYT